MEAEGAAERAGLPEPGGGPLHAPFLHKGLHRALDACPILFLVPTSPALLVPALLLVGAGYGGLLPSVPILAVHYFGRAHLGTILGAYKIAYDLAAAGAPAFTAALYDHYGTYTVAQVWLTAFAWTAVLLVVLALPHQLMPVARPALDGRVDPELPRARTGRG